MMYLYFTFHRAMYVTMVGTCTVMIMGTLCGFVVYAEYAKCDPVLTNRISSYDQVIIHLSL